MRDASTVTRVLSLLVVVTAMVTLVMETTEAHGFRWGGRGRGSGFGWGGLWGRRWWKTVNAFLGKFLMVMMMMMVVIGKSNGDDND